jgi:hypothetical protein
MSRSLFGAWGAGLPQESFARAVWPPLRCSVSGARGGRPPLAAARSLGATTGEVAVLRLEHLAAVLSAIAAGGAALPPAEEFVAAWDAFRACRLPGRDAGGAQLRLEIDPQPGAADRPPVLPTCRGCSGCCSAAASTSRVRPICAWMGGSDRSAGAGRCASPSLAMRPPTGWWRRWRRAAGRICCSSSPPTRSASCCCCRRTCGVAWRGCCSRRVVRVPPVCWCSAALAPPASESCHSSVRLRAEVLGGGVCIAAVERERHGEYVDSLLAQLAGDMPLDVALQRALPAAQDGAGGEPALLFAARRLAVAARLTAAAQRLGASGGAPAAAPRSRWSRRRLRGRRQAAAAGRQTASWRRWHGR